MGVSGVAKRDCWYVITGGPSTGKTTLLDELAKLGHATVPEAARLYIDAKLAEGLTLEQIRADDKFFQEELIRMKVKTEAALDPHKLTFFDRGMHDIVAYNRLHNNPIDPWVQQILTATSYCSVFILESLPVYEKDYARPETPEIAAQLNDLLFDAYLQAGMSTFRVPATSVPERLAFILKHINSGAKS